MKIMNVSSKMSFGRAFTTKEKSEYIQTANNARNQLGLGKTTAIMFDFSFPTEKNDTGIGTSFSQDAQKIAGFLKSMCGINSIQLQPQGEISNYVRSPYSGTSFSLGHHIIDLKKLSNEEYGELLTEDDLNSPYMNKNTDKEKVDYDNVFSDNGQEVMLKKAYKTFLKLDKSSQLQQEFEKFKKQNSYWLEKDALFEAAAAANGNNDMTQWSYRDQNIFADKEGDKKRIIQLKKVKDEEGNNVVDYEEFVQFIANKQQAESKNQFNEQGIDIYGDCPISFSQKDYWTHKSAFYPNYEFSCPLDDGSYSCWSPAINFDKLDGEAGELLYNKFDTFFKRYNGVRIDAAWQLINPIICEPLSENGQSVYNDEGNKLGRKLNSQPKIKNKGQYIIKDIILKAADNNGVPHNKVFLELLGGNSYDSLDTVKDLGTTLIHITKYGKNDWGRVKFYEEHGRSKYQNMRRGDYTIGPGTHDNEALLEQLKDAKSRTTYLSKDLHLNKVELDNSASKLSEAIWAELYTTENQFATLGDILGSDKRINTPNTIANNWTYRVTPDYERRYYENLSEGKGLNNPDALSKALKAKNNGKGSPLTDKLDYFANILRQKGVMTTKEADRLYLDA